jgi:hypothetical protein
MGEKYSESRLMELLQECQSTLQRVLDTEKTVAPLGEVRHVYEDKYLVADQLMLLLQVGDFVASFFALFFVFFCSSFFFYQKTGQAVLRQLGISPEQEAAIRNADRGMMLRFQCKRKAEAKKEKKREKKKEKEEKIEAESDF